MTSTPSFLDLAGVGKVVQELSNVLLPMLRNPARCQAVGCPLPGGVIFWGPSGTGWFCCVPLPLCQAVGNARSMCVFVRLLCVCCAVWGKGRGREWIYVSLHARVYVCVCM